MVAVDPDLLKTSIVLHPWCDKHQVSIITKQDVGEGTVVGVNVEVAVGTLVDVAVNVLVGINVSVG